MSIAPYGRRRMTRLEIMLALCLCGGVGWGYVRSLHPTEEDLRQERERASAYEAKIRDMMAVAETNRTDALREKMWIECADRVAWIGTGPLYKAKRVYPLFRFLLQEHPDVGDADFVKWMSRRLDYGYCFRAFALDEEKVRLLADELKWTGTFKADDKCAILEQAILGKGNIMCGKSLWEKLFYYREQSLLRGSSQLMQDYVRTLPETDREAFRTNFVREAALSVDEARTLFGDSR